MAILGLLIDRVCTMEHHVHIEVHTHHVIKILASRSKAKHVMGLGNPTRLWDTRTRCVSAFNN